MAILSVVSHSIWPATAVLSGRGPPGLRGSLLSVDDRTRHACRPAAAPARRRGAGHGGRCDQYCEIELDVELQGDRVDLQLGIRRDTPPRRESRRRTKQQVQSIGERKLQGEQERERVRRAASRRRRLPVDQGAAGGVGRGGRPIRPATPDVCRGLAAGLGRRTHTSTAGTTLDVFLQ
jgi:hypothetical protein